MRFFHQRIIIVVILIAVIGVCFWELDTAKTQSSNTLADSRQYSSKDDFLLVSMTAARGPEKIDQIRRERNAKFDSWKWVRETVSPESISVNLFNDWEVGLPAFPVKRSDAVAIGVVRSGSAFLSNSHTGIYSEFSVDVKEWLKHPGDQFKISSEIIVQRPGGRIRYPEGNVVNYSVSGQEMPKLDHKYLFFLKHDQQLGIFGIITAFDLVDSKILALDGRGNTNGSRYKFGEFDGIDEKELVHRLRKAIDSGTDVVLEALIR